MAKARFTQREVERAVSGARAAGFDLREIVIDPSGAISLRAGDGSEVRALRAREELVRHFREKV